MSGKWCANDAIHSMNDFIWLLCICCAHGPSYAWHLIQSCTFLSAISIRMADGYRNVQISNDAQILSCQPENSPGRRGSITFTWYNWNEWQTIEIDHNDFINCTMWSRFKFKFECEMECHYIEMMSEKNQKTKMPFLWIHKSPKVFYKQR